MDTRLIERELEYVTDDDSTASDQSGPGRLFDNLIGRLAPYIERPFNGPLPPQPAHGSPFALASQLSFTAESVVSADDSPGPGYTVNRFITWGGKYVERAVTWAAIRAGRDPGSGMKRVIEAMIRDANRRMLCDYCGKPYVPNIPMVPASTSLDVVMGYILRLQSSVIQCPCGATHPGHLPLGLRHLKRPQKKLIHLLKSSNPASRDIALQFLTFLTVAAPELQKLLLDLKTDSQLHRLMDRGHRHFHDPLLSYSRRALRTMSETHIFNIAKDMDAVSARQMDTDLTPEQEEITWCQGGQFAKSLIIALRNPDKQLFALQITRLYLSTIVHWFVSAKFNMTEAYYELLLQLSHCTDLVFQSLAVDLIMVALEDELSFTHRVLNQTSPVDAMVRFVKRHADLLPRLPAKLHSMFEEVPARYAWASNLEMFHGRPINLWRRALWRHDNTDPDGEFDDDDHLFRLFPALARFVRLDKVWINTPVPGGPMEENLDTNDCCTTVVNDRQRKYDLKSLRRTQSMHIIDWIGYQTFIYGPIVKDYWDVFSEVKTAKESHEFIWWRFGPGMSRLAAWYHQEPGNVTGCFFAFQASLKKKRRNSI